MSFFRTHLPHTNLIQRIFNHDEIGINCFKTKWNNFLPIGNSTFAPTEISGFFFPKWKAPLVTKTHLEGWKGWEQKGFDTRTSKDNACIMTRPQRSAVKILGP